MKNKQIDILNTLLAQTEDYIPFKDKNHPAVSQSDVGWQLDHILKVINAVCPILKKTDPNEYKKHFNFMRAILFPMGYIPRGKAKAPKQVRPPNKITIKALYKQLSIAKNNISDMKAVKDRAYFKHHIFGVLSKKQTLRFLEIHTKHHLKIVKDILKT